MHALRVVRQIKVKFPKCEIHWVIKSGLEGILESVKWIDRYFIFKRGKGIIAYLSLISEIRKFEYDYCLDLQGLLRSSIITKSSKSKLKLGRSDGREFSTLFYKTVESKFKNLEVHAIDRLTPFLSELGIIKFDESLPLDLKANSRVKNTVQATSIILFPESRRNEKIWPFFEELANWILKEYNFNVFIAGNHKDNRFSACQDLRGNIALGNLPEVVSNASLIICNDSAPLHIASALRKKMIALFGPTEPIKYGPYPIDHQNNIIIRSPTRRIDEIQIGDVKSAIKCLLSDNTNTTD